MFWLVFRGVHRVRTLHEAESVSWSTVRKERSAGRLDVQSLNIKRKENFKTKHRNQESTKQDLQTLNVHFNKVTLN